MLRSRYRVSELVNCILFWKLIIRSNPGSKLWKTATLNYVGARVWSFFIFLYPALCLKFLIHWTWPYSYTLRSDLVWTWSRNTLIWVPYRWARSHNGTGSTANLFIRHNFVVSGPWSSLSSLSESVLNIKSEHATSNDMFIMGRIVSKWSRVLIINSKLNRGRYSFFYWKWKLCRRCPLWISALINFELCISTCSNVQDNYLNGYFNSSS